MNQPRPCGCKGCRSCLLCEEEYGIEKEPLLAKLKDSKSFVFCPRRNKVFPGWNINDLPANDDSEHGFDFPGIYVDLEFLTSQEAAHLMQNIDQLPWDPSQSGRRKQNYGPKTNFKKRKIRIGDFRGYPAFSRFVQERFHATPLLKDYQVIEQCSLEYDPAKGASIDPHIDDCWVWGERVVTVNCLGDSYLTLTRYRGAEDRYNLDLVEAYKTRLSENFEAAQDQLPDDAIVRVPMPFRSLLVMFGAARYRWEHCVLREDIQERRVCIAYREFTPLQLPGGEEAAQAVPVLQMARQFWSVSKEEEEKNTISV